MKSENRWSRGLETAGIALAGALLFVWIGIPLPWLLGPLAAVMAYRLMTRRELYWPNGFQQFALIVLGYLLGRSFTRDTAWQVVHQLPSIFVATVVTIGFSLFLGYLVARGSGVDVESAIFGSVPGGLSQMAFLAQSYPQVDVTVVTLMQTIRLISIVMVVPFLTVHGLAGGEVDPAAGGAGSSIWDISAFLGYPWYSYFAYAVAAALGAWVGKKARMPISYLTGPMAVTALVVLLLVPAPPVPSLLLIVPQVMLGTHLGLLMKPQSVGNVRALTLYTLVGSVCLIGFSLLVGSVLSAAHGESLATGFLSIAPGGMAEMGATAALVQADLSIVSGYQFFRLFFIMFGIPPLLNWWMKSRRKGIAA